MEGKPDWLPGFPVQIYCNRGDNMSATCKTCFYIGHRDAPDTIYPALLAEVERHITELGVGEFIVGHYGRFDSLAARAVKELKAQYSEVELTLLLPYHPAKRPIQKPEEFDSFTDTQGRSPDYIFSIRANTTACCSSVNLAQDSKSFFCESVKATGSSCSANSWERVIPKAVQIFSREGMVGIIFFRYQEEIVDCGRPERSASWYSVQPRSSRYAVITERMSFT